MPISLLGKAECPTDPHLLAWQAPPPAEDEPWQSSFSGSFAQAAAYSPAALRESHPDVFARLHDGDFYDSLLCLLDVLMKAMVLQTNGQTLYTYHQLVSYVAAYPDSSNLTISAHLPTAFHQMFQELHNYLLAQLPEEFPPYGHRLIAYLGIQAATKLETQQQWAVWYRTITAHQTPTSAVG